MNTEALTQDNFQTVINSGKTVFIDFTDDNCAPCHDFRPIFEQAAERHDEHLFLTCDTVEQPGLAQIFGVTEVPTLAAVREGIMVFREAGNLPEEVIDLLVDNVEQLDMDEIRDELEKHQAAGSSPEC